MSAADLLPGNSGLFERAVAEAMTDVLPVPIAQVMDPAQTPAAFLPFLAAHEGVRLWFTDWPEARKRAIIADWLRLAELIGTRAAPQRFLDYVDAELVDVLTHPHRPFVSRYAVGRALLGHPPFRAVYLVKTINVAPRHGFCVGRHPVDRRAVRMGDFTPIKRASQALRVAKAPYTEVLTDFANFRPLMAGDAVTAGAALAAGQRIPRTRLGKY